MKILVIQLARLGDVYLSWPSLSGLRRKYPSAQIDFLVREKFADAAEGNLSIDKLIKFPTSNILSSLIETGEPSIGLDKIAEFCHLLRNEKYTNIINLSFSPFSSYLVSSITPDTKTVIKGYCRYEDGYLDIRDDVSAYFYAQVGVGKINRVHLTQIFSGVAEVELVQDDWKISIANENESQNKLFEFIKDPYLILQIGASQIEKTYGVDKWVQVLNHFSKLSRLNIVLVGTSSEKMMAMDLTSKTSNKNIINVVGQTKISDLVYLSNNAQLVVGCDSLMMHISSLTNTPCLNVSFETVNFWETGPLAKGSRIIYGKTPGDIASDRVAYEIDCMLNGIESGNSVYIRSSKNVAAYESCGYSDDDICWQFILALYMEKKFPEIVDEITLNGMEKLHDASELALEQIALLKNCKDGNYQLKILTFVDDIILQIPNLAPRLQPLVSWFQTERVRIGPAPFEQLQEKTEILFKKLINIISLYLDNLMYVDGENREDISANTNVFE